MPIEKGIDGLLFRTSMNYDELKDKIIQLIQHGFEKDKIIIHSDITLLEELNLSRIHFKNNDTTAFSYKVSHPNIIVGMSTHDVATVNLCRKKGLDYVFFGHLFPTMSHPDTPPRTTKEIQDVLHIPITTYAIGGINNNIIKQIPKGFSGICVISYFMIATLEEIQHLRKE
ncbi:thiamine phosphate synthase [Staphylococcus saccharolyticus]|nr:thiamine phosphate synthase [Staphylococcus saccharolyticus]MBL7639349.1 thiamine phosphate synthase [Staphylococcus saccharolyticus]QRJ69198.1 thiamine phosphate synthase [Staphylococcus saccharolyticus]